MLAIKIIDVKSFMNHLLLEDTFDHFLLCELTIKTGISYQLNGKINHEFYNSDENELMTNQVYTNWMDQKPLVFSIIKGKKTPLAFQIVFMLTPHNVDKLLAQNSLSLNPQDIQGLFFNVRYDGQQITCTTGTSLHIFTMDKTLEQVFDANIKKFLLLKNIPCEDM